MDGHSPASLSSVPGPPPRHPWYHWRRLGFNFLTISLLAHLLLGFGATYLVVQSIQARRKQTFASAPAAANAPAHAMEHKVQMQKKQQTMSAPAAVKRITTTSNARVALPTLPAMPSLDTAITPLAMAGMGGTGVGLSMGGGGGGGGGGDGGGMSLFGMRDNHGGGLEGTFYDYKMDQGYQPLPRFGNEEFGKMVREMLPIDGPWHPERPYRHYMSPAKLHGRYFIFPAIEDTGAGAAFQSPRSGPGHWLAVYHGSFSSPTSGSFRFVGFGDNVMIVQLGSHIVLDASDHGYTGQPREGLRVIKFPKKGGTPLYGGEWFNLSAGEPKDISIAVGDEGGIFCSGLFVQPRNVTYAQGENGVPKLPVFMLGAATDADRNLLGQYLPAQCLQGPFFTAASARPAESSIFSH